MGVVRRVRIVRRLDKECEIELMLLGLVRSTSGSLLRPNVEALRADEPGGSLLCTAFFSIFRFLIALHRLQCFFVTHYSPDGNGACAVSVTPSFEINFDSEHGSETRLDALQRGGERCRTFWELG